MLSTRDIRLVMLLMSLALLSMSDIIMLTVQTIAAACVIRPMTRAAGTFCEILMGYPSFSLLPRHQALAVLL